MTAIPSSVVSNRSLTMKIENLIKYLKEIQKDHPGRLVYIDENTQGKESLEIREIAVKDNGDIVIIPETVY